MSFLEMLALLYFIVPISIAYAAPLIFTAIGGVFSERSGVVNIGLEGLMVMGAFIGILFNLFYADTFGAWTPWLALLAAMVVSALFSIMHAVAIDYISCRSSRFRCCYQYARDCNCLVFGENDFWKRADGFYPTKYSAFQCSCIT